MQTYNVKLQSEIFNTFRCQRAANSLDIDTAKKSIHELSISADLESQYNIGLILGASGSGKTTLAKQIFGEDCFKTILKPDLPILEQLPKNLSYDECAEILSGIGLTSVPCWIRPVKTLSNGQKARAEAALLMTKSDDIILIDEWTSVVDRTVAKVMSHCIQKFARKNKKRLILLSCHYDVVEWLNPDWVIDCNKALYSDRRLLSPEERKRTEQLKFEIREIDSSSWKYFSKYHYLSSKMPGGLTKIFGLFHENNQIGFQCFANYVPHRKNTKMIMHSNRTVIHPDYAGLGLGIKIINETSKIMYDRGYNVMAKFSSTPIYRSMIKQPCWKLSSIKRQIGATKIGGSMGRGKGNGSGGFRENVKTYTFQFVNLLPITIHK